MKRSRIARCAVGLLLGPAVLLSFASALKAIVIRHDKPDDAYRELARSYPFCSLNLGGWGGGCTLIRPDWVVTAAHAVEHLPAENHRIEVGGEALGVSAVIRHPEFDAKSYRHDIALVRLAGPVKGQPPVDLYAGRDEAGQRVIFVGRGYSGTGESGPKVRDRVVRAAENRIEAVTDHWLQLVFDRPPAGLALEGISGPGDSGGPAFVTAGGKLQLIGISSWQDNREQGGEGLYGVKENYTRVSSYIPWIDATIAAHSGGAADDRGKAAPPP